MKTTPSRFRSLSRLVYLAPFVLSLLTGCCGRSHLACDPCAPWVPQCCPDVCSDCLDSCSTCCHDPDCFGIFCTKRPKRFFGMMCHPMTRTTYSDHDYYSPRRRGHCLPDDCCVPECAAPPSCVAPPDCAVPPSCVVPPSCAVAPTCVVPASCVAPCECAPSCEAPDNCVPSCAAPPGCAAPAKCVVPVSCCAPVSCECPCDTHTQHYRTVTPSSLARNSTVQAPRGGASGSRKQATTNKPAGKFPVPGLEAKSDHEIEKMVSKGMVQQEDGSWAPAGIASAIPRQSIQKTPGASFRFAQATFLVPDPTPNSSQPVAIPAKNRTTLKKSYSQQRQAVQSSEGDVPLAPPVQPEG